jgi:hypothetical protein
MILFLLKIVEAATPDLNAMEWASPLPSMLGVHSLAQSNNGLTCRLLEHVRRGFEHSIVHN